MESVSYPCLLLDDSTVKIHEGSPQGPGGRMVGGGGGCGMPPGSIGGGGITSNPIPPFPVRLLLVTWFPATVKPVEFCDCF